MTKTMTEFAMGIYVRLDCWRSGVSHRNCLAITTRIDINIIAPGGHTMNEPTSTPRRPIVPGPSGIAAKAIAVREQAAQQNVRHNPDGSQLVRAPLSHGLATEQQPAHEP